MYTDKHSNTRFPHGIWQMRKFWQSLNLPFVLFTYLLLLQVSICCLRYGYQWLGLDFQSYSVLPTVPPVDHAVIFHAPDIRVLQILVDLIRLGLIVLAISRIKLSVLIVVSILLLGLYQNDFNAIYTESFSHQLPSGGMLFDEYKKLPAFPVFNEWEINWQFNPLFRLSLLYEIVVRIFVLVVLIYRFFKSRSDSIPSSTFRLSIADLLLLVSFIAITLVFAR